MWPFLPGLAVLVGVYLVAVLRGGRFLFEERFNIMQALDQPAVAADTWGSLLDLHAQPPLMNALYALTDATPERLGWVLLVAALATTAMVVDTVRVARGRAVGCVAGLLYALLPATVLYALFPYSTTMTALFAMVTLWGVARIRTWPASGVAISAVGVLGLFLVRASFVWLLAIGWLVVLGVVLARARVPRLRAVLAGSALLVAAVGVGVVQVHYSTAFGIPTLSSWSAENVSNALVKGGLTEEGRALLAAQDPCFAELLATGAWGPVEAYPSCVGPDDDYPRGAAVLDQPLKTPPASAVNFNAGARLALAEDWNAFVRSALADDPGALIRVALGTETSPGSLSIFLSRADVYYQTLDLQKAGTPWFWNLLGLWSAAFPFLAWTIVLAAAVRAAIQRASRAWLPASFWFALALLVLHAVPSVFGDLGENNRFRAEFDPVLLTAAVIGLGALVRPRRTADHMPSAAPSNEAIAEGSPSTSS